MKNITFPVLTKDTGAVRTYKSMSLNKFLDSQEFKNGKKLIIRIEGPYEGRKDEAEKWENVLMTDFKQARFTSTPYAILVHNDRTRSLKNLEAIRIQINHDRAKKNPVKKKLVKAAVIEEPKRFPRLRKLLGVRG